MKNKLPLALALTATMTLSWNAVSQEVEDVRGEVDSHLISPEEMNQIDKEIAEQEGNNDLLNSDEDVEALSLKDMVNAVESIILDIDYFFIKSIEDRKIRDILSYKATYFTNNQENIEESKSASYSKTDIDLLEAKTMLLKEKYISLSGRAESWQEKFDNLILVLEELVIEYNSLYEDIIRI